MNAPDRIAETALARPDDSFRRNLVALGTIARREVQRILRIWTQTLIPPAITMKIGRAHV